MRKKLGSLLLAFALIISSFPAFPSWTKAAEETKPLLDIGFGGAFSTEKGYTSATGEIMYGSVSRRAGSEQLVFGEGVVLKGGTQGVEFAAQNTFGTATVDQPVIVEVKFKPESSQGSLGTIIGIMGNMFVRYQSASTLEYGFDSNVNGTWQQSRGTVAAPAAGKEHSFALVYEPAGSGATVRAFLDGTELKQIVSTNGRAAISTNTGGKFAFGNDVHPSALNRGFNGSISRAVVTELAGPFTPSMLKTMDLAFVERSLKVLALGTLSGQEYKASADELALGNLEVQGARLAGLGRLAMSGDQSRIAFTPNQSLVQDGHLAGSFVAEITFESEAISSGAALIDLAGAVKLRKAANEALEVLIGSEVKAVVNLDGKLGGEFSHLSLVYNDNEDGTAAVELWWGQERLADPVMLEALPGTAHNAVIFAGDADGNESGGFAGEVYGVALGKITGKFKSSLLALSGGPCFLPEGLEPGHRIAIGPNECPAALAAKASLVRPDPRQVEWQQYEQTAFLHYGINTYYDVEWGNFNEDPNMFQPTELDTDQWARTLKESGFKMAILTVKHHDGFVLYPTRYTDFGVASSSWRDGKGDVLREFVTSMRKYGIKVGVYLSPSDHGAYTDGIFANGSPRTERVIPTMVDNDDRAGRTDMPSFKLPATDYGAMLLNQLYEVLTEYGPIDEVWFDGSQGNIPAGKEEKYDWDSYYTLIRELMPEAVVAVTGPDVRWVGNESGWARENEWSVLGAKMNADGTQGYYPSYTSSDLGSRQVLAQAAASGMEYLTWWPAEVDVSIRSGWFYHANQQPKSVSQLKNIYYQSVARNAVLLLNIPPDKRGKLADSDVARLREWNQDMKRDFAFRQTEGASVTAENGAQGSDPNAVKDGSYDTSWASASAAPSSLTFKTGSAVSVDKVVLQEDIRYGQQVESFAIDVRNSNGDWEQIAASGVIGYKRIVQLPKAVSGEEFRVRILGARGAVHLAEVGFYLTGQKTSDKTALDSLIVEAEMIHDNAVEGPLAGQYPVGAKATLAAAIDAAGAMTRNPVATQEQVNDALSALQAAMDAFIASVNDESTAEAAASLTGPDEVKAGETFTVQFGLNHLANQIYAQDITISYDDAVMEFVSAKSLVEGVQLLKTVASEPGKLRLILASAGAEHAVTGDAQLIELTFTAKNVAEAVSGTVAAAEVIIADGTGEETAAAPASTVIRVTVNAPGIPGDVNGDGNVSIGDLAMIAAHYGKHHESPDWDLVKHADVNNDNKIDIADLVFVAKLILGD